MSSSASRGAGGGGGGGAAASRGRRGAGSPRRRRQRRRRCGRRNVRAGGPRLERPGFDARRSSTGRVVAAARIDAWRNDADDLADLDEVRVRPDCSSAIRSFPVLAVVETDPDQRVTRLHGVEAGLAGVDVDGCGGRDGSAAEAARAGCRRDGRARRRRGAPRPGRGSGLGNSRETTLAASREHATAQGTEASIKDIGPSRSLIVSGARPDFKGTNFTAS